MIDLARLFEGGDLRALSNDDKNELSRLAVQGMLVKIANELWTKENVSKMTILAKVVEVGTGQQRESLRRKHLERLSHSLTVLTCLDVVIPISNLEMPQHLDQIVVISAETEETQLPPNVEGN